ncbi:hypothetical protein [uncultured Psychroserpens sp.]|uniref:hypothetical protein n=1 Tax=uncultured Psychroserpens sp. TaxID=255436 RepID=UPI002615BB0C|nr:hypothetical protein [uncultured Psychroserpens sp.]
MSYHIYTENNKELKLSDILQSEHLPTNVAIAFGQLEDEIINGYSKLYIPHQSSRGVVITKDDTEYDIELNIGSSKEDYHLASKIALALGTLNNSKISPEFDESLSLNEFEKKYDTAWAEESQSIGVSTLISIVKEKSPIVKINGCKRGYYFGENMINEFSIDNPDEKQFTERLVENIRRIQFIEDLNEDLNIPSLMEADFPEGVKTFIVVPPEFKLLLLKSDFIVLNDNKNVLKVEANKFIDILNTKSMLERLDEEQYIMNPIKTSDYAELMALFNKEQPQKEKKNKKSWKFWK